MRGIRITALTAIFSLFVGVAAAQHAEELNTVKIGDDLPAFKGRNIQGDEIDLGDLTGEKAVVLAFWSIYCKPCVEEISSLIRLQEEFGGSDLEVIGVNTDSELGVSRIRKFISRFEEFEQKQINYQIIYDEDNRLTKLLGIGYLPTVLTINKEKKVDKIFVGFEEKSEEEIFEGIKGLLPTVPAVVEEVYSQVFEVEAVVPMCGFYGPDGWMGSFMGNRDLDVEIEKISEIARMEATRLLLKEALLSLGMNLAEIEDARDCFRDYGVYIMEDPMDTRDNLTNLIRELTPNLLIRSLETIEDSMETEYRVFERARVDLAKLRSQLETLNYQTTPRTVAFNIVNVNNMDQNKFEKILLQQSRYIGSISFPTFEIYTSVETFAKEIQKMDFQGLKFFIEEIAEDSIELEVWR